VGGGGGRAESAAKLSESYRRSSILVIFISITTIAADV